MQRDLDRLTAAYEQGHVTRRIFLGSLAALAAAPRSFAQAGPPIPISAINHMTLSVSDPARSLEWYQGLFGMPMRAVTSCEPRRVPVLRAMALCGCVRAIIRRERGNSLKRWCRRRESNPHGP